MKLSTKSSIRVLIRKQGSKATHITLEDTTIEEATAYIKRVLKKHVDPFAEGRVTSITISKAVTNGTVEPSVTFSFKGIDPGETRLLICEAIAGSREKCV